MTDVGACDQRQSRGGNRIETEGLADEWPSFRQLFSVNINSHQTIVLKFVSTDLSNKPCTMEDSSALETEIMSNIPERRWLAVRRLSYLRF
jgi:hypothetical protein